MTHRSRRTRSAARAVGAAALLVSTVVWAPACGGARGGSATGPEATSASLGPGDGGASQGGSSKGGRAPDFTLPTLDGKNVSLSDYSGKVVLLDFWSTTCDPCMTEMPHLVALYEKHKAAGFVVLAVSADGPETRAQVSSVAHDKGMTFPVLLDEETSVIARYNPKKDMPFSALVDRSGNIVHKTSGYTPGDEAKLAAEVEKLLQAP
jgi:peroxiredoxin